MESPTSSTGCASAALDPRRVGEDLWEARCPVHRGPDHALAVSRNEFNHVLLECRAAERCRYARIVNALGFTNDLLYEDTPDWLISRLKRVPIQTSLFQVPHLEVPSPIGVPPARSQATDNTSAARTSDLPLQKLERPRLEAVVLETPSVTDTTKPSFEFRPRPGVEPMTAPDDGFADQGNGASRRFSSVRVLTRLAECAQLFRSADGRFVPRFRSTIVSRSLGSLRPDFATG